MYFAIDIAFKLAKKKTGKEFHRRKVRGKILLEQILRIHHDISTVKRGNLIANLVVAFDSGVMVRSSLE